MGDLKGATAVHFNFPLLSFSLYITFKSGLPLPVSLFLRNRGGLVNVWAGRHEQLLQSLGQVVSVVQEVQAVLHRGQAGVQVVQVVLHRGEAGVVLLAAVGRVLGHTAAQLRGRGRRGACGPPCPSVELPYVSASSPAKERGTAPAPLQPWPGGGAG